MRWFFLMSYISYYFISIDAANILAVFPLAGRSHFIMFEKLMKGLVERGHQVDVMSHFPLKKPIKGYNDLSLEGTQGIFTNNMTMEFVNQVKGNHIVTLYMIMRLVGYETCEATFNSDIAKSLLNSKKKYDLVITELFTTDCMLGWGYHFGVPIIALSSSAALPWANDRFGNPDNPAYIPTFDIDFKPRMSLYERVYNTYYNILTKLMYKYIGDRESNKLAKAFFGPDLPDLRELAYNTSLLLVNSHFSTNIARPTVPNFVEVGGLHIAEPKPLTEHFQKILKTDKKGIIYFSMGSMVMAETFPINKLQGMFDAFAELPYKVIWKADKEKFPKEVKFPENIHFEKWMPQMDILCHPNVKLFVSHGGLMGGQEAMYCGVPRLGIPLFGDQEANIKQSENLGIGKKVAYDDITKESILEAVSKLLNDPKYAENAKLISEKFKDRPMKPLDTALYWTEYVIRHKGASHLRSIGAELPWYQYHLLDVALILVSIPIILVYLLFYFIKSFVIRNKQKSKKD